MEVVLKISRVIITKWNKNCLTCSTFKSFGKPSILLTCYLTMFTWWNPFITTEKLQELSYHDGRTAKWEHIKTVLWKIEEWYCQILQTLGNSSITKTYWAPKCNVVFKGLLWWNDWSFKTLKLPPWR